MDAFIVAWSKRIAATGIVWLSLKLYFFVVLLPMTWLFCLILAMGLVGVTPITIRRIRNSE